MTILMPIDNQFFYNLLIINIWATTGTRTPDLLITNELLYQLSYGGNLIFSDLHRNSIHFGSIFSFWTGDLRKQTPDPRITNALLYQLSHNGKSVV